jgi:hypothetical protein
MTLGGYQGINLHILIQFYTNGSLYVKQSVLISDIHVHVYGIWSYVSFQLLSDTMQGIQYISSVPVLHYL